ncbi:MAG TPA: hypothetical protein VMO78_11845 [Rhizomicrobium sp.]|nr:hypothetical protein [Rhizomicrobium sp.]
MRMIFQIEPVICASASRHHPRAAGPGLVASTDLRDGLAKTITYFDALPSAGDGKPERLAAVAAQ